MSEDMPADLGGEPNMSQPVEPINVPIDVQAPPPPLMMVVDEDLIGDTLLGSGAPAAETVSVLIDQSETPD